MRRSVPLLLAALVVLLAACGGGGRAAPDASDSATPGASGSGPPSVGTSGGPGPGPGSTTSPGASPKSSVAPPPPPGTVIDPGEFETFRSAKWGYTLRHPRSWREVKVDYQLETESYFSNESGIQSALELSDHGIWLTVRTDPGGTKGCYPNRDSFRIVSERPMRIDGVETTRYVTEPTDEFSEHPFYSVSVYLVHLARCNQWNFLTRSAEIRDAWAPTDDAVLASFRF